MFTVMEESEIMDGVACIAAFRYGFFIIKFKYLFQTACARASVMVPDLLDILSFFNLTITTCNTRNLWLEPPDAENYITSKTTLNAKTFVHLPSHEGTATKEQFQSRFSRTDLQKSRIISDRFNPLPTI